MLYSIFLAGSKIKTKRELGTCARRQNMMFKPRLKCSSLPPSCALQQCSRLNIYTVCRVIFQIHPVLSLTRICKVRIGKPHSYLTQKNLNLMLYIILFDSSLCQVSCLISLHDFFQESYSKIATVLLQG